MGWGFLADLLLDFLAVFEAGFLAGALVFVFFAGFGAGFLAAFRGEVPLLSGSQVYHGLGGGTKYLLPERG